MRNLIAAGLACLAVASLLQSSQGFAQGWQPPTNLGANVNTSGLEDGNSISQNGVKLYLATDRPGGYGGSDIWASEYIGGVWQVPTNLGPNVNSSDDEFEPSITADGSKLYFSSYRPGGYGDSDIWVSENVGGVWQPPTNLGGNINTPDYDACPSISNDGTQLYFVSPRAGGQGFDDIWVSQNVGGVWQPPTNLGPNVNTGEWEWTPSISSDGLKLYFASDRPGGYGWLDLWVSEYSAGVWQPPTNLGNNINTVSTEGGPSISSDGRTLYFAAFERAGGYGGFDIWVSVYEVGVNEHKPLSTGLTDLTSVQPNPFGRMAEISFSLPASGHTTLRIYDTSARLVRTLVDESQGVGHHSVEWDGKDASGKKVVPGIYICRLAAGESPVTRKMVLLR